MKRMLMTLAAGLVMVCGWASLAETIDTHKTFLTSRNQMGSGAGWSTRRSGVDRSLWRPQKHGHVRIAG